MGKNKLAVLWTSPDKDVALKMVYMYSRASKKNGWWDEVKLIVWGPSAKLLAEDTELQEQLKVLQGFGVEVIACKSCADMYGMSSRLEALGIEVFFVGQAFTDILQSDWKTITI